MRKNVFVLKIIIFKYMPLVQTYDVYFYQNFNKIFKLLC